MNHTGTKNLETDRLVLRRFRLEDAEAMYKNWACDPEVTRFLTWPPHESVETSRAILRDWVDGYTREDCYQWAVVLREKGDEPIGSIGVVHMNEKIEMAHVGYCIGRPWWRRGITSEALGAVIDYLFNQAGFRRIEARHDARNPYSGKVMEKCGMRYEGVLRQADWNNQGVCDVCYYGLLVSDQK